MTRGRKTNTPTESAAVPPNHETLAQAGAAATELVLRSQEIADRFADGVAYGRERVVGETRFFLGESAQAMLEAGKRLIQIKENESHGDFVQIVEQQLGINVRTGQLMMAAAAKYLSPRLEAKAKTFSLLSRAKLFDLMQESDGDLEHVAEGGTLAGHSFDELQAMSVREMRLKLADAEQTLKAKDKRIQKLADDHDKLVARTERPFQPDEDAKTADERAMLDTLRTDAVKAEIALRQAAATLQGLLAAQISPSARLAGEQCAQWLAQLLGDALAAAGVAVDMEEAVTPHWMRDALAQTLPATAGKPKKA